MTATPMLFADCNPGPPSHWILSRPSLRLLHSRHEDNPTLFDAAGGLTPQGERTMGILDSLTGVRKERLRFGRWAAAEGVVYEEWDAAVHVVDPFPIPADWRRIRAVDFGYTNPFVCLWLAMDHDGRAYVYRQLYHTKRLVEDHARQIVTLSGDERIETTICDHDAEDRATLARHGVPNSAAWKTVSGGIEGVKARLRRSGDGRHRLFVLRGSLVEPDEDLFQAKRPTCLEREMECYSWPKGASGRPVKEDPVKVDDHACDALRYAVAFIDELQYAGGGLFSFIRQQNETARKRATS